MVILCNDSIYGKINEVLSVQKKTSTVYSSDVTIVTNIRSAIVGNATMLPIDSRFYNQKSSTSAKNNLIRINTMQTQPK
jgi:hypothetical protein